LAFIGFGILGAEIEDLADLDAARRKAFFGIAEGRFVMHLVGRGIGRGPIA
jgi:hypothetical protein